VAAGQVGHERRQPIVFAVQPAVLDSDFLALDVAGFVEGFTERTNTAHEVSCDCPLTKPTTGIAGCCARAFRGHAAAAPPSSAMKLRRFN